MSNPIGTSWAEPSFADNSWVAGSWGVIAVVTQDTPKGGHRIPNKYEPINARRARAQAAKRKLDEERRRLAELKKQEAKVVAEYKAIALPETPAVPQPVVADRSRLLELQIRDFEQRVALQNAKVKALRKESEIARREAEERETDAELAMQAHRELQADEWERQESARIAQEREDEEMQMILTLIHEEDF